MFFASHFISDPLTLALGETNEEAVMIDYHRGSVDLSAGAFNGDVEGGDDDFFVSISLAPFEWLNIGGFLLSDIADTDAGLLDAAYTGDTVAGFGGFARLTAWQWTFSVEYIGAADNFDARDLDGDSGGDGDRPNAFNIEAAYQINGRLEFAAKYEGTKDLFDLPEVQYGMDISYLLFENVSWSLEYLHGRYQESGSRELVTTQFAVEF